MVVLKKLACLVYPYLLVLFFFLHQYQLNRDLLSFPDLLELLAIHLLAFFFFYLIMQWLLKNKTKASLMTFCTGLLYFFFGPLQEGMKVIGGNSFLSSYSFLLPLMVVVWMVLLYRMGKSEKQFRSLSQFLPVTLFALLLYETGTLLFQTRTTAPVVNGVTTDSITHRPDIYLVVADEYAGQRQLKELFQFDNSQFIGHLRQRGFTVWDSTYSNYNPTVYSMASLFQMDYLSLSSTKENNKDLSEGLALINYNRFLQSIQQYGYTIYNHSIFRFNHQSALRSSQFFTTGKERVMASTLWGKLNKDIRFNLITRFNWTAEKERFRRLTVESIDAILEETVRVAGERSPSPRFIYTHLLMPHYPYFQAEDSSWNSPDVILQEHWSNREQYLSYLKFTNRRLLHLVDNIRARSAKPPVILLLSDHGFRYFQPNENNRHLSLLNLNAVFIPESSETSFYDGMSNVNVLPALMNTLFKADIPLRKDSSSFIE